MGQLVDGRWTTGDFPTDTKGRFVRKQSSFREFVQRAPTSRYPQAPGRYHLYVSLACPWAHRTLIARRLKHLETDISISVVRPHMGDDGWDFAAGASCSEDSLFGARYLRDIYLRAEPKYTGRVTVPVLWDKENGTIVNNESLDILYMLDRDASDPAIGPHLFPENREDDVRAAIDANYESVNNGVYRAGFATSQEAYDTAVTELFARLDALEAHLSSSRYLLGDALTAADICLFTTLFRFDPVYSVHFKCSQKRLVDFPSLWAYTRDIYQLPRIAETCNLDHIRQHYYGSHRSINPHGIVPIGPLPDYAAPAERGPR